MSAIHVMNCERDADDCADQYVLARSLGYNVMNGNVALSASGRALWTYIEPAEPIRDHFFGTDRTGD